MQAFSELEIKSEEVCHFWSHLKPNEASNCLVYSSFSPISIIMDSLGAKICQLSNFLSLCGGHYSDEHTFISSWTKTTLVFIFLNRFLLCAVFSHCCNTVTKIATFANFMYQAGFFFFYCQQNCQCCRRQPHNLFLLSSDKSPR